MTPRVFLHGFLGAPCSWRHVRHHLDKNSDDQALTVPGHQKAHAPLWSSDDAIASGTVFNQTIRQLWREVKAKKVDLIGYSLGGRLALGMALAEPGRVARLIVVGAHGGLEDKASRHARRQSDRAWAKRLRTEGLSKFLEAWEDQPLFASQKRLGQAAMLEQAQIRKTHHPEALARGLEGLSLGGMPYFIPHLYQLPVELICVVGGEDSRFIALAQQMVLAAPQARRIVLAGIGHNGVLEAPHAIAQIICQPLMT